MRWRIPPGAQIPTQSCGEGTFFSNHSSKVSLFWGFQSAVLSSSWPSWRPNLANTMCSSTGSHLWVTCSQPGTSSFTVLQPGSIFGCGQCPRSSQVSLLANMMPVCGVACVNFSTSTRLQSMTPLKQQLLFHWQLEDSVCVPLSVSATQFNSGELNFIFEIIPHKYSIGLMIVGKSCLAAGGGSKRRYQYCSDNSETISLPLIGNWNIPLHLSHWMCIQSSLYYQQWIDKIRAENGQYSSCPLIQETKDHKDPEYFDFSVPRRAKYVHSAWKKHQDAVFWVDINLAIKEGLTFYQTRSKCNYPSGNTSSLLCSKSCEIEDWRSFV